MGVGVGTKVCVGIKVWVTVGVGVAFEAFNPHAVNTMPIAQPPDREQSSIVFVTYLFPPKHVGVIGYLLRILS